MIDIIIEKLNAIIELNEKEIKDILCPDIFKKSKDIEDLKTKINALMDKTGHEGISIGLNMAIDVVKSMDEK